MPYYCIDDYRIAFNQSKSYSGEYHAWNQLHHDLLDADSFVFECSGGAKKLYRILKAHDFFIIKVISDNKNLMSRIENRKPTPVPAYYGSVYKTMYYLTKKLESIDADIIIENNDSITDLKINLWDSLQKKAQQIN